MFWFVACAGGDSAGDGGAGGEDSSATGPTAVHYFGTSVGQTPDGSYVDEAQALLFIRTLDAGASTVTEEYWEEGRRKWDHGLLVHSVDAAGETFTSTWDSGDGMIQTTGAFDAGEAWAWTAWHSTSVYLDGAYVDWVITSTDTVDDAGVATADKAIRDEDGVETWRILEVNTPTDEESFQERLAEIEG